MRSARSSHSARVRFSDADMRASLAGRATVRVPWRGCGACSHLSGVATHAQTVVVRGSLHQGLAERRQG